MLVSKIPLVDFYRNCLKSASDKGFILAGCLIAREYKSKELYSNLFESWSSLHDLSGKKMLLMFAGHKNESLYVDFYVSNGNDERYSNQAFSIARTLPYHTAFNKNSAAFNEDFLIAKRQTLEIESLKEFFNIESEKELPCFVLTIIENNQNFIIPIRNVTFYEFFESLFIKLEPFFNEHTMLTKKMNEMNKEKERLEGIIRESQSRIKRYGDIECIKTDFINSLTDDNFDNRTGLKNIQRKLSLYINILEASNDNKTSLISLSELKDKIRDCGLKIDEAMSSICNILSRCKDKLG